MKKTFIAIAAGTLMSIGGIAGAAEQLSDSQMDQVAAGSYAPYSWASSTGFAVLGTTGSGADSSGFSHTTWFSKTKYTQASAVTLSSGVLAYSTASAGSGF